MDKLNSFVSDKYHHPFPVNTEAERTSSGRLVIPILETMIDISQLAQRIWKLASSMQAKVLLIGISPDHLDEPSVRRQLVMLAAAIQDGSISVDSMVVGGVSWMKKMEDSIWPGDTIVFQPLEEIGLKSRSISQQLTARLQVPVHILASLQRPKFKSSGLLPQIILWLGAIGIMAGFFWTQVKIDQLPKDWAHTTLFCISIFVEVGLLLFWNSLFS